MIGTTGGRHAAKDLLGVAEEVAVDAGAQPRLAAGGKPGRCRPTGRWAAAPPQDQDVGDHVGAVLAERGGGQADRPDQVGVLGQQLTGAWLLAVEGEPGSHHGDQPTRMHGPHRSPDEVVVQAQLLRRGRIVGGDVGERHIAAGRREAGRGQGHALQRCGDDACVRVQPAGDPRRHRVALHPGPAHRQARGSGGDEQATATARLQHRSAGKAQPDQHAPDGGGDGWCGVEAGRGGLLGGGALLGGEQLPQPRSELLPGRCALMRVEGLGHRPPAGPLLQRRPLSRVERLAAGVQAGQDFQRLEVAAGQGERAATAGSCTRCRVAAAGHDAGTRSGAQPQAGPSTVTRRWSCRAL